MIGHWLLKKILHPLNLHPNFTLLNYLTQVPFNILNWTGESWVSIDVLYSGISSASFIWKYLVLIGFDDIKLSSLLARNLSDNQSRGFFSSQSQRLDSKVRYLIFHRILLLTLALAECRVPDLTRSLFECKEALFTFYIFFFIITLLKIAAERSHLNTLKLNSNPQYSFIFKSEFFKLGYCTTVWKNFYYEMKMQWNSLFIQRHLRRIAATIDSCWKTESPDDVAGRGDRGVKQCSKQSLDDVKNVEISAADER